MRVALVHYWLLGMRGGEKVLEAFCRMFPEADIFTLFYEPERVSPLIRSHHVTASFLNPLRRFHRSLLPLMPVALEHFDLRGYDLVISSESGPAKGVLVSANSRHVCYCHSPMRYLWELYPFYLHESIPAWKRPLMATLSSRLRLWDYATASRVDTFVANSKNTAKRIQRAYRRSSTVVHPPVAVERCYHEPSEGYLLIVSEFVAYKQLDYAVATCSRLGLKLKLVGDGPDYRALRALAGPTVEFCGRVSEEQLWDLYARCRAVLVPGEEDFGMVAVEGLASGKPIVGLGRGGTREIIGDSGAGVLYDDPSVAGLGEALDRLAELEKNFTPVAGQRTAARFSEREFRARMESVLA